MQPAFKYVDIKVDFPSQKKSVINKLHRLLVEKDFYMADHDEAFYHDGLRIEGLKNPYFTIEWLNNLLFEMDIPATLIEFTWYHPLTRGVDFETEFIQSINPQHCIPCRRT